MSQCIVPNWNLRHQRQQQLQGGGTIKSSHAKNNNHHRRQQQQQQQQDDPSSNHHLFPTSNYEVREQTWLNGQLAMQGLGGLLPTQPTMPTWSRSNDTLESIVQQGQGINVLQHHHNTPPKLAFMSASSAGKLSESSSGQVPIIPPGMQKKRSRDDSDQCARTFEERADGRSGCTCASASAAFCKDSDTTMMTWASYESPKTCKAKTLDDDSACHGGWENQDEDRETKAETGRSHSSRRIRAAAVHNQSERRRRDRINQKIKALQRLVPNASKTDKASMLDEVIQYLKQLQSQLQMMNVSRSMPQMMMPLGMQQQQQQHLQMCLLAAQMGMGVRLGMGMGMLDMNTAVSRGAATQSLPTLIHPPPPPPLVSSTSSTPTFVPSPFLMPSMIATTCPPPPPPQPQANSDASSCDTNSLVALPDHPYRAFLAQSMNMELYNKMAALYSRQQVNQTTAQAASSPSQSNRVQLD